MLPMRFLLVPVGLLLSLPMPAAESSGEAVYTKRCAGCHEQTNPRVPHRHALEKMPSARILSALDSGAMMAVAMTMDRADRIAVASYLGTTAQVAAPPAAAFCSDRTVKLAASPKSSWNGWSPETSNARFQTAAAAQLSLEQVRGLKLKWA